MFKELLDVLPPDPTGTVVTTVVAVGIGIGALTALLGALHSRVSMAMFMFAVGCCLGYAIPADLHLAVNVAVTICVGGIAFGLIGFLLHRFCVALWLGIVVAGVAVAILHDQTQPMDRPSLTAIHLGSTFAATLAQVWHDATPSFRSHAGWVGIVAFAVAGLLGFFFRKFGMAALYSLTGTLLMLFAIDMGHASPGITWLDSLRTGPMTTATLGFTSLLVGFLSQMALLYRGEKPSEDAVFAATA